MELPRRAVVLSLVAFGACVASPHAEPTVRALRYRQFVCNSVFEFSHHCGQWLDCLFLPDSGVVCTIAFETVPCMYARRSNLADELALRPQESPLGKQAPEEIEVSAAFAREAVQLASLTERQRAIADELGARCVATSLVRGPLDRDF